MRAVARLEFSNEKGFGGAGEEGYGDDVADDAVEVHAAPDVDRGAEGEEDEWHDGE